MAEDEQLVVKNKVVGVDANMSDEISYFLRPKPNKKFLQLYRLNLQAYYLASKGKINRLKNNILTNYAEKPALLDSEAILSTQNQIGKYLLDKGYFHATVGFEVKKYKRKRVGLKYLVQLNQPCVIGKIEWPEINGEISDILTAIKSNTPLKAGFPVSRSVLDEERDRISVYLRNRGYFYFKKDFIYFEIDTLNNPYSARVVMRLKESPDPKIYQSFQIGDIYLNTDFSLDRASSQVEQEYLYADGFQTLLNSRMYIRRDVLVDNILFRKGDLFNDQLIRQTQVRLSSLSAFSYLNIRFEPIEGTNIINIRILMQEAEKRKLSFDASGSTNAGTTLGVLIRPTYENRNVFKGAETFQLSLNGGLESQQINNQIGGEVRDGLFNTSQFGATTSLLIPRFSFPFHFLNQKNYLSEKTRISFNFNSQQRADYDRSVLSGGYGFDCQINRKVLVNFYPIEVNLVRTNRVDSLLNVLLQSQNDPYLTFSFSNHLTTNMRLGYTYNNLNDPRNRKLWFYRLNAETAGNLVNLLYPALFPNKQAEFPRKVFGLPYFHYLRLDGEVRRYYNYSPKHTLALRAFAGAGIPLSNSTTLPLEKRYFIGGNNSLRAWPARSLGPGSNNAYQRRIDHFGEVRIEGNLEYRFPLYGIFKGAVFLDAGNIWSLKDTVSARREFSNFNVSKSWRDIAVGTGFGLRIDFTYFIIRFDMGIKLRDPSFSDGNRWVIRNWTSTSWREDRWKSQLNPGGTYLNNYRFWGLNLGVGVPF